MQKLSLIASYQRRVLTLYFYCLLVLGLVASYIVIQRSIVAASSAVVINEIMYNPSSDNSNDEFIELHNTSGSPVDVGGWCFTAGINMCFAGGTTISPHGYLTASPSASQSSTTYGIVTAGTYTGSLSNSGEAVTLVDATTAVVDTVTYDDATLWPLSPDGSGPSLELKDPLTDNSNPLMWAASDSSGGTPGVVNSVYGIVLPTITQVTRPTLVTPSTPTVITANVTDVTMVQLIYRVMYAGEQTVTMYDDGSHGDGAAGDGKYGANIPGQTAGSLIRFRVEADNADGSQASPSTSDTMSNYAFIVDDGHVADIPIVRWYMDPTDFTDMTTNHLLDDQQFPAVVAVGEQIFDSAVVRVKGNSSTMFDKRKYNFELPKGYTVTIPTFRYPVKEFSLDTYMVTSSIFQQPLAWQAFNEAGFTPRQNTMVRVYKNSGSDNAAYHGLYLLLEDYDKTWRAENNFESGSLYKGTEKKTRLDEDNSDLTDFQNNVSNLTGTALKNYLLKNVDIPNFVNFYATSQLIRFGDWDFSANAYVYHDIEGSGRWEYLPWDIDDSFDPIYTLPPSDFSDTPLTPLPKSDNPHFAGRFDVKAILQFPEFREMYYRRLATLYDRFYGQSQTTAWYDSLYNQTHAAYTDDVAVWGDQRRDFLQMLMDNYGGLGPFPDDYPSGPEVVTDASNLDLSPEAEQTMFHYSEGKFVSYMNNYRSSGVLPNPQVSNPQITITEIMYNPSAGDDGEYLELYNPNDQAVDLSGWQLDGIDFTFPQGSVLAAHSYGVIVRNDAIFSAANPGVLVLGQFNGGLSNSGETLRLLSTDQTVISGVTYSVDGQWPRSANGGGYSLNLARLSGDEMMAGCWAPSANVGGTPGRLNNVDQEWTDAYGTGCTDKGYDVTKASSVRGRGGLLANTSSNFSALAFLIGALLIAGGVLQSRHAYAMINRRVFKKRSMNKHE